jgi:CRP-like cAMP-binding protein
MHSILLQEMSNADIEWLLNIGQFQELAPNTCLNPPQQSRSQVYLLIDGAFTLALPFKTGQSKEFAQAVIGEIIGNIPSLEDASSQATVQAKTQAQVIAIDSQQLANKLTQDLPFAAHFYRLQVLMLMQRLQALTGQLNLHPSILYKLNPKEASSLLSELQDNDLDWFVAVGKLQQLALNQVLQYPYRPIEALYIVLDGSLSITLLDSNLHPCHQMLDPQLQGNQQELARLARGDLFGELRYAYTGSDTMPIHTVQVKAVRSTELLSVPHWRLTSRLLHDPSFAARFYRVLANLLASKYQTLLQTVGFILPQSSIESGDRFLSKVAMAEARFDLMMKRVQTKTLAESTI